MTSGSVVDANVNYVYTERCTRKGGLPVRYCSSLTK
jgi:hypothetical protein